MVLSVPETLQAGLFDPLGEDEFWRTVYGKSWHAFLQNPSQQDRFEPDFSHASFLRLMQVPSSWSQANVKLVVHGEVLPARKYCQPSEYRRDPTVLVPDWKIVKTILSQGATLVLNAVDLWHDGANRLAGHLESLSLCRAQANLYWTEGRRKGFDIHYDAHDVFVLQLTGRKLWKIYQGVARNPDDPVPPDQLARQRAGEYFDTVDLKAGDILYLPAGRYHEASVYEQHSIHLSFALKLLRPKDVMAMLFAKMTDKNWVNEPLYLRPQAQNELRDCILKLQTEFQTLTEDPTFLERILSQAREAARQRDGLNWESGS